MGTVLSLLDRPAVSKVVRKHVAQNGGDQSTALAAIARGVTHAPDTLGAIREAIAWADRRIARAHDLNSGSAA